MDRIYNGYRNNNAFYRDSYRRSNLGSEHSLMVNSERLFAALPSFDMRLEHNANYSQTLEFVLDGTPAGGSAADKVVVQLSSSKSTTFIYDENRGRYAVEQHGRRHIDGNNNEQLHSVNVLVLKTHISGIPGDDAGRRRIDTVGSGTGYFINGGRYVEINWSRASNDDQFRYTLTDGSTLQLGRGNSYICIIPLDSDVRFE